MNRESTYVIVLVLILIVLALGSVVSCGNSGAGTQGTGTSFDGALLKPLPSGYSVLYSFASPTTEGGYPNAGVIRDKSGNLYGTTAWGGAYNQGTVFKLNTNGTLTVLHSFTAGPTDGSNADPLLGGQAPVVAEAVGLIMDSCGNLYGNTQFGGGYGGGTVFKIDASGNESVLHSFYAWDGLVPSGKLVMDTSGNLYGTTTYGGPENLGTVFSLDTTGMLTTLYSFTFAGTEPAYPTAGLIIDKNGNLYGTTVNGGTNDIGSVFKLATNGTLTVLHSFNGTDGANPWSDLIMDNKGNLYGTTVEGGDHNLGIVFKLDTSGTLTVLHSFNGTDGAYPFTGLIMDNKGNLYGTTDFGGTSDMGTVFKLDANGTHSVLHDFSGADGSEPMALTMDNKGIIYGTTFSGGPYNKGTIFRLVL